VAVLKHRVVGQAIFACSRLSRRLLKGWSRLPHIRKSGNYQLPIRNTTAAFA
jgi:hypothetical protein